MAVIYIILSLLTAILFILTRKVRVGIEKREFLTIKIDLIFFTLCLFDTDKAKKKRKKAKADKKFIYQKISDLLSRSKISVLKLDLSPFGDAEAPSLAPLWLGNRAVSFAILAYLKGASKQIYVSDDALDHSPDDPLIYHLILTAPMYLILYTSLAIRFGGIKKKYRRYA